MPHTATTDGGSFDTSTIELNRKAVIAFDKVGTYPYHCTPHPFMKATIEVEE